MNSNGRVPKVWVTQEHLRLGNDGEMRPRFDLSKAAEFGQLEFLTPHGQLAMMPGALGRGIERKLRDFDGLEDFVLLIGDPTIMFATAMILGNEESVRVLRWDNNMKKYGIIKLNRGEWFADNTQSDDQGD